jgi:hypothetical protein
VAGRLAWDGVLWNWGESQLRGLAVRKWDRRRVGVESLWDEGYERTVSVDDTRSREQRVTTLQGGH